MSFEQAFLWSLKKSKKPKRPPIELPPKFITRVTLSVRDGGIGFLKHFIYDANTISSVVALNEAKAEAKKAGKEFYCVIDSGVVEIPRVAKINP